MKLFSLIDKDEIHISKKKRIIPATAFEEILEAKEIIDKAHKDAAKYSEKCKKQCKDARAKSREEGYQEGLKSLNEHILALDAKIREVHHEMHKMILPIALKAAKKILGRELETKPESIVDIVLQALRPVREAHRIKILVSKEDLPTMEEHKADIKEKLDQVEVLTIEERPHLNHGDCIIETESGIINATLENQWRALEAAFETHLKKSL